MEILSIKNLSFAYAGNDKKSLEDISFTVNKGDFLLVCGKNGCGKSTLLRLLKKETIPVGELSGEINLNYEISGFVGQYPNQQIVTDKVWHELAFGLENLGMERELIGRRIAEVSAYFGIEHLFEYDTDKLSGGQKQLLNLAAAVAMQPDIIILDEPSSQLDPINAADFINTLKKLNDDTSITIVISEHRLENIIPFANKMLILSDGRLKAFDNTKNILKNIRDYPEIIEAMPASVRIFEKLGGENNCPVTIKEGRQFLEANFENDIKSIENPSDTTTYVNKNIALEFRDVYFRFEKNGADILRGMNLKVHEGEIMSILGGNGSGKTTALSAVCGLYRCYSGSIRVFGKKISDYKNNSLYENCIGLLPQDVHTVLIKDVVGEEFKNADLSFLPFSIEQFFDKHPYDLSGGQLQLTALAKVLLRKPRLLLLDEPTKALDCYSKNYISQIIKELKNKGITVVIVTHDAEFAVNCSDRCAMLFRGEIISADTPRSFFSGNSFYTTQARLISKGFFDNAVTAHDIITLCTYNKRK